MMRKSKHAIAKVLMLLTLGFGVSACNQDILDDIHSLEDRVTALEKWQSNVNMNIDALQRLTTALDARDFLVDVSPLTKSGEVVGKVLTFSKAGKINVYDGATPEVGIMQDADGYAYWTYQGEWLLDNAGSKVMAKGSNGTQGITPELKIENNRWKVSTDFGKTWTDLGAASADPQSSLIQSMVESADGTYMNVTLNDGRVMQFALMPKEASDRSLTAVDIPDPVFLNYLIMAYDTNNDGAIQLSEINQVRELIFPAKNLAIKSLKGIEYFSSLEGLEFSNLPVIETVDLSMNSKITGLNISSSSLAFIKTGSGISSFYIYSSKVATLDMSASSKLTWFDSNYNLDLETIVFADQNQLRNININNAPKLRSIDVKQATYLQNVGLGYLASLTEVNLKGARNLSGISIYELATLEEIDVSSNKFLNYFSGAAVPMLSKVWISSFVTPEMFEQNYFNIDGNDNVEYIVKP